MKKNYTHIGLVLDSSTSMRSIKAETISGFNEFLEDQKKTEGDATVTLVQFNTRYNIQEEYTDIKNVDMLTESTFIPSGMTALRDALGVTIDLIGEKLSNMKEEERPEKVVICVMTDGEENSSIEYTPEAIKSLVEQQTNDYNWEFVFVGANQDAFLSSKDLGFSAGKTMTYAANVRGTKSAFSSLSKNISNYRGVDNKHMASAALDFDADDVEEQLKAGV